VIDPYDIEYPFWVDGRKTGPDAIILENDFKITFFVGPFLIKRKPVFEFVRRRAPKNIDGSVTMVDDM
jgi:hypothetical protein